MRHVGLPAVVGDQCDYAFHGESMSQASGCRHVQPAKAVKVVAPLVRKSRGKAGEFVRR